MKLLDPVLEFNPQDDFGHTVWSIKLSPFGLGRHHKFDSHCEAGFTAEAAFGFSGTVADSCECAFNWVGRSDVFSMLGWEIVEGQEDVAVFSQFGDHLIVFDAVGCHEEIESRFSKTHAGWPGVHGGFPPSSHSLTDHRVSARVAQPKSASLPQE